MICPSCGLHNASNTESCVGCNRPLPPSSAEPTADPNPPVEASGNLVVQDEPVSSPAHFTEVRDSRQPPTDRVSVPDLQQEPFEATVKDFLDRDFVRTEPPASDPIRQPLDQQESAPSGPTLPEAEPATGPPPGDPRTVSPAPAPQAVQSGAATAPRSQGTLFPDKIQRIEIKLNQSPLPFGESKPRDAMLRDSIREDLRSASVWDRFAAGIVDTLFIVGCWLIFSLVVIAFTDFTVLSVSAGLGLGLVFLSIALSYFFLFTVLGARTPGMDYMGLAVIRFDGGMPSLRDVGLRIFGYCISAGCFGLGFLWAFFDSERLTWHDRISKTLVIESGLPPGD